MTGVKLKVELLRRLLPKAKSKQCTQTRVQLHHWLAASGIDPRELNQNHVFINVHIHKHFLSSDLILVGPN